MSKSKGPDQYVGLEVLSHVVEELPIWEEEVAWYFSEGEGRLVAAATIAHGFVVWEAERAERRSL
jgi:hypothetical protein